MAEEHTPKATTHAPAQSAPPTPKPLLSGDRGADSQPAGPDPTHAHTARPVLSALHCWSQHFFQPCPGLVRTLSGSALAALLVGVVWFGASLATHGWPHTRALLPPRMMSALSALYPAPSALSSLESAEQLFSTLSPVPAPAQHRPSTLQNIRETTQATQYGHYEQPGQFDIPEHSAPSLAVPSPPDIRDTVPLWRFGVDSYVRRPLRDDALPYSEDPNAPLSEAIKQIDFALLQAVQRLKLGPYSVQMLRYTRRQLVAGQATAQTAGQAAGQATSQNADLLTPRPSSYMFQQLRCYLPPGMHPDTFAAAIDELLGIWSDRASMHRVVSSNNQQIERLNILADGQLTHELFLSPLHQQFPVPPPSAPLLTIVIDDMGANLESARRLLALGVPLSISIWPRAAHAASVADMAWKAGQEVLIHQPAEPLRAPVVQTGPGAVLTRMSAQEIAAIVERHVKLVPHATGLNNHMGSRFSLDEDSVRALSTAAAAHGLFVLDSLTHPRSVFARTAAAMHITSYRRAVFLDDPLEPQRIRQALEEADRLARKHGQAIAIGHPHPETIDALRAWLRTRSADVRLVPLRALRPLLP